MKRRVLGTFAALIIGIIGEIIVTFLYLFVYPGFDSASNTFLIIVPSLLVIGIAGFINWYLTKSWIAVGITIILLVIFDSQVMGFSVPPF